MKHYSTLAFNPFYEKHDHEVVGDTRIQLLDTIISDVDSAVSAKAPFIMCLLGSVGVGKSFTLLSLSNRLNDPTSVPGNKKYLSVNFEATLSGPSSRYIEYMYQSMMRSLDKKGILTLREEFETIIPDTTEQQERLSEVDEDYKNAFVHLKEKEHQNLLINWLKGERTNLRDLKKIGIYSKIEDATGALEGFSNFSIVLEKMDYSGLILCIDEAEEIYLSGISQLMKVLTQIKKVYEKSKANMSKSPVFGVPIIICLCFTEEAYRKIAGSDTIEKESSRTGGAGLATFLRRIGREYYVDQLTPDELKELIKVLMNKARVENLDSFAPFDETCIDYIISISQGIPGDLLQYLRPVLQEANNNEIDTITQEDAIEILTERGILPEEGIEFLEEEFDVVDI